MTLTAYTPAYYTGTNSTAVYAYPFRILQDSDLVVIQTDLDGVETTLALTTDYTVTGAGAYTGGSITLTAGNLPTGYGLALKRVVPITQPTSIRNQGAFYPSIHEDVFDRQTMVAQQQGEELDRSLKISPGVSPGGVTITPTPGYAVGFDANGDLVAVPNTGVDQTAYNLTTFTKKTDLAATTGAGMVGTIVPFAGGEDQTQAEKNIDILTPENFRCDPTGTTACHVEMQKAIDAAVLNGSRLVGRGTYKMEGNVSARSVGLDFSAATIVINDATSIFTIGGSSSTTNPPAQRMGSIYRSTPSTTVPTLRVRGTKTGIFEVQYTDYMQIYADTDSASPGGSAANSSIAYCLFNIAYAKTLELNTNPTTNGSTTQWINENHFNLGRCYKLLIDGTYPHNHNFFHGGTFETQAASITINNGWSNYLNGIRFENVVGTWATSHVYSVGDRITPGGPDYLAYKCLEGHTSGVFATDLAAGKWVLDYVVNFAAGTTMNVVRVSWASGSTSLINTPGNFNGANQYWVSDLGVSNHVISQILESYHFSTVATCGIQDEIPNTMTTGQPGFGRTMTLQKVRASSGALPCRSDYLEIVAGDIFNWSTIDHLGALGSANCDFYRTRVEFFDNLLRPVTANTNFVSALNGSFATASGNTLTSSSDQSLGACQILAAALTAGVRYVRVSWFVSANSASTTCIQMEISHGRSKRYPMLGNGGSELIKSNVFVVSAIPTQGYCGLGKFAVKSDGTARWLNAFAFETTTSNAEAALSTVIEVAAGTGTANGDIIGINLDDGTTHWTTIASGGGTTTITITAGIASGAAAGSRVVFNRWVTA